ncbi:MAG: GIY-YIG nuclease family protein [Candidatus Omnitrophota bacterium]
MHEGADHNGYVYIFTNRANSVLYTGVTSNLLKRSCCHKRKYLRGFTKRYNLSKLVYYELFTDMVSARIKEREIKGWKREKKIGLIESMNPKWKDLYTRLREDPSALRPQDDPYLNRKTPRGVI